MVQGNKIVIDWLVLQLHPGHFVGMMGKVIIKLCNGATKEASEALMKPCPQVLGPLGIMHLLEGITSSILHSEAELAIQRQSLQR